MPILMVETHIDPFVSARTPGTELQNFWRPFFGGAIFSTALRILHFFVWFAIRRRVERTFNTVMIWEYRARPAHDNGGPSQLPRLGGRCRHGHSLQLFLPVWKAGELEDAQSLDRACKAVGG